MESNNPHYESLENLTPNLLGVNWQHRAEELDAEVARLRQQLQAAEDERDNAQRVVFDSWRDKFTYPQLHLLEAVERAEAAEAAWDEAVARLAAVEGKAARYERAMYEHGCDSSYVCGFCEREYGPTGSPTNSAVSYEDWQKRRALMMERDAEPAQEGVSDA